MITQTREILAKLSILSDQHWDSLGICLSKIPAFFDFLNKVRCNTPYYHIADSIARKLICHVSTYLYNNYRKPIPEG